MSRISRAMSWPLTNSAEPTTRTSTPKRAGGFGGLAVDPAVDVDLAAVGLVAEDVARRQELGRGHVLHVLLATEPGFDGHDQDDVEELGVGLQRGQRRRGSDGQSGRPTGGPDAREDRRDVLLDLDVEGDRVAAGVQVLVEEATRLADHQVRIEGQLGPTPEVP